MKTQKRDVPVREDGQDYARVTKMLGNGRLLATCTDGKERLCIIKGSMRKREWVYVGDTVLVGLRSYQDGKADVIFKYQPTEIQKLKKMGEVLPTVHQDTDTICEHVDFDHVNDCVASEFTDIDGV
jgi:translation initiation factor 1A